MAATMIITKKEADLLNQLSAIDQQIVDLVSKANSLKEQLIKNKLYDFESSGSFVTRKGTILTITERAGKQIPPSIDDTIALLKLYRKGHRLNAVCKVDVAALRKEINDEAALKKLIKRGKPSCAWSFGRTE